jgi:hypothetical protein
MSGGGGSGSDGSGDMQVSGMEAAVSKEKGISTHAESRTGAESTSGGSGDHRTGPTGPDTSMVGSVENFRTNPNTGKVISGAYSDAEIEKGITQYGETLEDYGGVTMTKSQAISSGIINKDPETGEETAGRYRYNENTQQLERTDLSFKEHWDNAPKAIRWSPTLRFLYSSGKNLSEWAKTKGWNFNSNTGNFTDDRGGNVGERQLMNAAAPDAPGLVANQSNTQTTTGYSASQWYANLGNTNTTGSNPFSFSTAFADAKAKQQTILGNPSAIKQLAVNESPFYGFLKENSLDKGIL